MKKALTMFVLFLTICSFTKTDTPSGASLNNHYGMAPTSKSEFIETESQNISRVMVDEYLPHTNQEVLSTVTIDDALIASGTLKPAPSASSIISPKIQNPSVIVQVETTYPQIRESRQLEGFRIKQKKVNALKKSENRIIEDTVLVREPIFTTTKNVVDATAQFNLKYDLNEINREQSQNPNTAVQRATPSRKANIKSLKH